MRDGTKRKKTRLPVMIAVTGGIGSGKSTVLAAIREKGYYALSCDDIARELYAEYGVCRKLKKLFPEAFVGRIFPRADKKKLSEMVFNDKSALTKLNSFMHPLIMSEVSKRAEKSGEKMVFVEVPLLFECSLQDSFDKVLILMRDDGERIKSVMSRSSLTHKEVLDRMNNQTDYVKLDKSAYTVIVNDGTENQLKQKAEEFCKQTEKQFLLTKTDDAVQ